MAQLSEGEYPIFHVNARIILSLSAGIDIKKKKNIFLWTSLVSLFSFSMIWINLNIQKTPNFSCNTI